jgi:hypothetical protein
MTPLLETNFSSPRTLKLKIEFSQTISYNEKYDSLIKMIFQVK